MTRSAAGTIEELWAERFAEPVFALTADQDWAPEWAIERFLAYVREERVPVHVFTTNPSAALGETRGDGGVTLGAHPNFGPGSTQGSTPEKVIATCRSLVPDARTFRSHSYAEDAKTLSLLLDAGFETDSNLCLFLQPNVVPLLHATGLLRLPVFLDDDSLLLWDSGGELDLEPMRTALATPGLKILNFHPTLFALNAPSAAHYEASRASIYGTPAAEVAPYEGRGIADVLREVIETIRSAGHALRSFEEIADEAWRDLRALPDPALYGWAARPGGA